MNCLMPFYKYISSSFFYPPPPPLVVLHHLGCVGYRALEGDKEKEGTPRTGTLWQCCGVVFLSPSFPSFPLTSVQTARESLTVQGVIQTQVRNKRLTI